MFAGLPNLNWVNVAGNYLQHIPAGAIQLETDNAYVIISYNDISSIAVDAITGWTRIKRRSRCNIIII